MTANPTTTALLTTLARQHPGAHPYTLALLLQAQHGRMVTGQEVKRLLRDATG